MICCSVMRLTLLVGDEEILAGEGHEDEGDPEPDRGAAPGQVSHHSRGVWHRALEVWELFMHDQYHVLRCVLRTVSDQLCSGSLVSCHAQTRVLLSAPDHHRLSLITNFAGQEWRLGWHQKPLQPLKRKPTNNSQENTAQQ